ncbi:MAG: hypothetical protein GX096_03695 [Clostridiales bacterium]|nr:hypothetical protein [Clostridiales bacterium]
MRILTSYHHHTGKLSAPMKLAVISDVHNDAYEDLFPMIEGADVLLVPGDIANRYTQSCDRGLDFLRDASKRLPTFFSVGNHETRSKEYRKLISQIEQTGAEVLINRYVRFEEIWLGGWYEPDIVRVDDMLDEFEALEGCKVLMCHKPDQYMKKMRDLDLDLVVAGHAHGGQVRILNRGIYSPDQGLFPKYTRGVIDDRLIVSAGVSNPNHLPRWGNPCEVLMITLD